MPPGARLFLGKLPATGPRTGKNLPPPSPIQQAYSRTHAVNPSQGQETPSARSGKTLPRAESRSDPSTAPILSAGIGLKKW